MAYPVFYLALFFMGGILAAPVLNLPVGAWAYCVGASLFLAWACLFRYRSLSKALCCLLLTQFCMGAGLFSYHDRAYHQNRLHTLRFADYLDVEGTLYRSPAERGDRDHLYLRVEVLHIRKKHVSLRGNLRVSVPRSPSSSLPSRLLIGDRVRIAVRFLPFPGFRNTPGGSLELPYQIQNIHRLAFTKSPLLVERFARGRAGSPKRAVSALRKRLLGTISERFQDPRTDHIRQEGAVLEALLLGERGHLDEKTSQEFQASGLYHLLAISGAHIAILTLFLYTLLRRLGLPEGIRCILMLFALFFFSLLVEGRPSVIRACLMASLYLVGKTLWKDVNLLNTLASAALILLFIQPATVFSLGFQLTFAATLSIILFQSRIKHFLPRLPFRLHEVLAVTLAAQAGVLSFSVRAFHRVTWVPLLLNAAALPLVAGIMASGYVFLFIAGLLPGLAEPAAWPVRVLLSTLLTLARMGSRIPLVTYRVPTPPMLVCAAYTFFLLAWRLPRYFKGQNRILSLGFGVSLLLLILHPFSPERSDLAISFIDVGSGDAILVEMPGRETMLVDGGGVRVGTFDIGDRVVSPFLWDRGITRVDTMVLTHPHPDHSRGLQSVARNFKVGEFWEASIYPIETSSRQLYEQLPASTPQIRLQRGSIIEKGGVRIEVLHPSDEDMGSSPDPNRYSLVLRLIYGRTAVLLTGDITSAAEYEILEKCGEIEAEVMKSPHHGSRFSSSRPFLEAVAPRIIVISTGRQREGLPSPETLERYVRMGIDVYRTDIHGAVTVISDGTTVSIRTTVPLPPMRTGYAP